MRVQDVLDTYPTDFGTTAKKQELDLWKSSLKHSVASL